MLDEEKNKKLGALSKQTKVIANDRAECKRDFKMERRIVVIIRCTLKEIGALSKQNKVIANDLAEYKRDFKMIRRITLIRRCTLKEIVVSDQNSSNYIFPIRITTRIWSSTTYSQFIHSRLNNIC